MKSHSVTHFCHTLLVDKSLRLAEIQDAHLPTGSISKLCAATFPHVHKTLASLYFPILLALLPCMYWDLPDSPENISGCCQVLQARELRSRLTSRLSVLRVQEAGGDSGTLTRSPNLNELTARIRQESWEEMHRNPGKQPMITCLQIKWQNAYEVAFREVMHMFQN